MQNPPCPFYKRGVIATSFHGFRVSRRDVESCYEKTRWPRSGMKTPFVAPETPPWETALPFSPPYGSFHGFRVSRRDMRYCLSAFCHFNCRFYCRSWLPLLLPFAAARGPPSKGQSRRAGRFPPPGSAWHDWLDKSHSIAAGRPFSPALRRTASFPLASAHAERIVRQSIVNRLIKGHRMGRQSGRGRAGAGSAPPRPARKRQSRLLGFLPWSVQRSGSGIRVRCWWPSTGMNDRLVVRVRPDTWHLTPQLPLSKHLTK